MTEKEYFKGMKEYFEGMKEYFEGMTSMINEMEHVYLTEIKTVIHNSPEPLSLINGEADVEAGESTSVSETIVYEGYAYDLTFDQVKAIKKPHADGLVLLFHVDEGKDYCENNKWLELWHLERDAVMDLLDHIVWPTESPKHSIAWPKDTNE